MPDGHAPRRGPAGTDATIRTIYQPIDMQELKKLIREVPDFPKPGILFYDITTLLKDPRGLRDVMEALKKAVSGLDFDIVAGIESRGFIFAPVLALELGTGFVPVRKPGKLPSETVGMEYQKEYGADSLEVHKDAIPAGAKVLVIDDLLATGGTAAAVGKLIEKIGGSVAGMAFLVELDFLRGRDLLAGYDVRSLLHYDS